MTVSLIFKIAAVGILVSVIGQVLKHSGREEHAFLTSLAGLILVLFWIVPYIYDLFETIKSLFSLKGGIFMFAVAVLGIAAMLLAVQLREMKNEYSLYVALGAGIIIFSYGVDKLSIVLETIEKLQGYLMIPTAYFGTLVKMVGITYLSEFASSLCRDGGQQTIATQLEMFGKLSILAVSTPVILALFETIESLLS